MKAIPISTCLLLCALTNSPCQSLDSLPDATSVSQPGTPGVAMKQGVVNFTDHSVDAQTGTLRMRAVVPNKDGSLLPGLFVRGRLTLGEPHKALLILAQAVMADGGEHPIA